MRKVVIMNLGMIVTEKCNLDCQHCMRGKKCDKKMSDEVIEATLSQFWAIENLCICGGEPTLAVDVIEKIFNYIIKNNILIRQVTAVINGTIYSSDFLECLDMIENYILTLGLKRSETSYFTISNDKYHEEERKRLKLDAEFIRNVENYKKSKYFLGIQGLNPKTKLFREGNATKLDDSLTVPLKVFPPIVTHIGKKIWGNFFLEDIENGICHIGCIVTVNCNGTITDCNASFLNQEDIYNYGNVLNDSIYDVCIKRGEVVKPHLFSRKLHKQEKEYLTYND